VAGDDTEVTVTSKAAIEEQKKVSTVLPVQQTDKMTLLMPGQQQITVTRRWSKLRFITTCTMDVDF